MLARGVSASTRMLRGASATAVSSRSQIRLQTGTASAASTPGPSPSGSAPVGASSIGPSSPLLPSTSGGPNAPAEYCASLVRRLDPDAWLTSYFWPARERRWFLALRAFNLELHLITTLTQPALAAIRFQFWRDAIKAIYSSSPGVAVPQHPVAVLLREMREARPVQRYYLSQMIDVRSKTLSSPPAAPTLASHLATHGPLHSALLLGPLPILLPPTHPSSSSTAHVLSHLASLLCVVSLLRSLPVLAHGPRRALNLPADVCATHGVVEEDVLRNGAAAKGLRDAVYEVGTRGMDELITARREVRGMRCDENAEEGQGAGLNKENNGESGSGRVEPKVVRPLFLSSIPAESYLERLEALDFDPFHASLQQPDWKLAPTIWWRSKTGKL